MIPTLIGISVLCYSALWLRMQYSGQIKVIPALVLLRVLALAAIIWAACEIALHHEDLTFVRLR
jgi:hypothetical protein